MEIEKSEVTEAQQFMVYSITALKEIHQKLLNDPVFNREAMDSNLINQIGEIRRTAADILEFAGLSHGPGNRINRNKFNIQQG